MFKVSASMLLKLLGLREIVHSTWYARNIFPQFIFSLLQLTGVKMDPKIILRNGIRAAVQWGFSKRHLGAVIGMGELQEKEEKKLCIQQRSRDANV